jgi:transcriptional regulator with XRE-family HTH domain
MEDLEGVVSRLREERGISLRGLAKAVHQDPSYVSRVIRGLKPCGPALARAIDEALQAGGEVIQVASRRPDPVSKREALVAPEVVGYFRDQLAGHYTADMFLGPRHLIPIVEVQAEQVIQLARSADAVVRQGLLDTGAAFAALLGWLYQDAGDLAASARWRDTTLSLAHRSGDPQLISYALTNKAMLALDQGDGRAVVDYARAALAGGRALSPKARVLAIQHAAHGHAMLGDRASTDRLLDDASALAVRVDDEHLWGNACRRTLHYVEVQRATCYGRTGSRQDAADAAGLWDQILDTMPDSARRDNAVFRARQAAALAAVPEPDRAVAAAAQAATAVMPTGSARLVRELKAIPRQASAWTHTRAGRELRTIVASVA